VPLSVGAALAEVGAREAAISLAVNPGAELADFSMRRMIERFGDDGEMREALLARPWLPATIRSELVAAAAASLSAFVIDCAWLSPERAERMSRERARQGQCDDCRRNRSQDGRAECAKLCAHLRTSAS